MATTASLPREVLRWLLSLDLSFAVRNIKRDFSNGFLFAEILSRYYPADVALHSFDNCISVERKRANWVLLEKLFRRRDIPVDQAQADAVINAEGDAASEVLQAIYGFIHIDAFRESLAAPSSRPSAASPGRQRPSRQQSLDAQQAACSSSSAPGSRHPSVGRSKSAGRDEQVSMPGYCCGPDGMLYAAAYGAAAEQGCSSPGQQRHHFQHQQQQHLHQQQLQQQQQLMAQQVLWQQQMMYQQQQQQQAQQQQPQQRRTSKSPAAAADEQAYLMQMQAYAQMMGALSIAPDGSLLPAGPASPGGLEDLAFSKKPRPVEFTPYKMSDYEARNYDVKKAAGYWQLGRLGPEETRELLDKREAKERVKALSCRIHAANAEKLSAGPPPPKPKAGEASARRRAAEYAKSSVPRPSELPKRRSGSGGSGSSSGRQQPQQGHSRPHSGGASSAGGSEEVDELALLQQQHELYAAQVEAFREELERSLPAAAAKG